MPMAHWELLTIKLAMHVEDAIPLDGLAKKWKIKGDA